MSKTLPLRCTACHKIVGSVETIDPTDTNTEFTNSEMIIEQHSPECPVFKMLIDDDFKVYSIQIEL